MTGDTIMKKENTINQEQEEMVFAEPPAQVIFNEKKEPDDIVEDDAEKLTKRIMRLKMTETRKTILRKTSLSPAVSAIVQKNKVQSSSICRQV